MIDEAMFPSGDFNRVNGAAHDYGSPFGGHKQLGKGSDGGLPDLEEYLELKPLHLPEAANV